MDLGGRREREREWVKRKGERESEGLCSERKERAKEKMEVLQENDGQWKVVDWPIKMESKKNRQLY